MYIANDYRATKTCCSTDDFKTTTSSRVYNAADDITGIDLSGVEGAEIVFNTQDAVLGYPDARLPQASVVEIADLFERSAL